MIANKNAERLEYEKMVVSFQLILSKTLTSTNLDGSSIKTQLEQFILK